MIPWPITEMVNEFDPRTLYGPGRPPRCGGCGVVETFMAGHHPQGKGDGLCGSCTGGEVRIPILTEVIDG